MSLAFPLTKAEWIQQYPTRPHKWLCIKAYGMYNPGDVVWNSYTASSSSSHKYWMDAPFNLNCRKPK